jgi:hypothetical protein
LLDIGSSKITEHGYRIILFLILTLFIQSLRASDTLIKRHTFSFNVENQVLLKRQPSFAWVQPFIDYHRPGFNYQVTEQSSFFNPHVQLDYSLKIKQLGSKIYHNAALLVVMSVGYSLLDYSLWMNGSAPQGVWTPAFDGTRYIHSKYHYNNYSAGFGYVRRTVNGFLILPEFCYTWQHLFSFTSEIYEWQPHYMVSNHVTNSGGKGLFAGSTYDYHSFTAKLSVLREIRQKLAIGLSAGYTFTEFNHTPKDFDLSTSVYVKNFDMFRLGIKVSF